MSFKVDDQALVIPSGFQLQAEQDGFSIGNQGDVVIRGRLSLQIHRLFSGQGSVLVESQEPVSLARVEAPQGDVVIMGPVQVQVIVARRVDFRSGQLTVRELVADQEARLGGESFQADIVLSPRVDISPALRGRATVIESKNELGPNLLKGGFRLDEYLEIFPAGSELLNQYPEVRARMSGWKEVEAAATSTFASESLAPAADPAPTSSAAASPTDSAGQAADEARASGGEGEDEEVELSSAEIENDVLVLTEAEAIREAVPTPRASSTPVSSEEELYQRLSDAFLKIIGCYSDIEQPPPLSTLEGLIEDRRFDDIKKQINGLWSELLQFHKREGLHIANAVTHNIQEIKRVLAPR